MVADWTGRAVGLGGCGKVGVSAGCGKTAMTEGERDRRAGVVVKMAPEVADVLSANVDADALESMIAAAYAAALPIPLWWPAAERAAFIAEYAGHAACALLSELDDVIDDAVDWAARHRIGNDDHSAMITARQRALLDDALDVAWDLSEDIAECSAALITAAVFDHHRPSRVIWPPTQRRALNTGAAPADGRYGGGVRLPP